MARPPRSSPDRVATDRRLARNQAAMPDQPRRGWPDAAPAWAGGLRAFGASKPTQVMVWEQLMGAKTRGGV